MSQSGEAQGRSSTADSPSNWAIDAGRLCHTLPRSSPQTIPMLLLLRSWARFPSRSGGSSAGGHDYFMLNIRDLKMTQSGRVLFEVASFRFN